MSRSAQGRMKTPQVVGGDGTEIRRFFERFSQAITKGDGKTISTMFAYPALAIANDMSKPITTAQEVDAFFSAAPEQYKAKGIVSTRPDIHSIHWNTDRIATVEVEWPYLDAQGVARGSESSTYILHCEPGGEPKLQVMLMQGEQQPASP